MRAKLREPGESLRWFFDGLAAICIGAAVIFRVELGPPLAPVFFMGAALLFVAPFFHRRASFRDVEVELQPGLVRLASTNKNDVTQIAVRSLTGASTARMKSRFGLALAMGAKKTSPVTLTFDREDDLQAVTNALGIGRGGFGILTWDRGPRVVHRFAAAMRLLGGAACVAICVLAKLFDPLAANLDTRSLVTLLVVASAAFVTLVPIVISKRTISLSPDGVHTFEERARSYKYADIAAIRLKTRHFLIDLVRRGPGKNEERTDLVRIPFLNMSASFMSLGGLDDTDVAILEQHILTAAQRARTPGAQPEHVESVRQLLARRENETNEAWIQRLDTLADSWRTCPPRHGEASSARPALWQAVEDHDCDEHVRMLAARMLARLDPEAAPPKLRVIVEAIRDPRQAARIRMALDSEAEHVPRAVTPASKR